MSGLLKLHALAAAYQRRGQPVDWAAIRRDVLRSKPPYGDYLDSLVAFIVARSGGVGGQHMLHLRNFHNAYVQPSVRASLPAALYNALADFPQHFVALAIWQAAYTCPPSHVSHAVCTWVTASEVTALAKADGDKAAHLVMAERALACCRLGLPDAGVSDALGSSNKLLAIFVKLDVAMARYLLSKQEASKAELRFSSVAAVVRYFAALLLEGYPQAKTDHIVEGFPLPEAVADPVAIPAVAPEAAAVTVELHTLDESGQLIHGLARLRQHGFEIGSLARLASEGSTACYRIARVAEATEAKPAAEVILVGLGDAVNEKLAVDVGVFLSDWALATAANVTQSHPGWPSCRVAGLPESAQLRYKGTIYAALGTAAELVDSKHVSATKVLAIQTKPSRKVLATAAIPRASLVLLPETGAVKITDRVHEPVVGYDADGLLEVVVEKGDAQPALAASAFWLSPCTGDKSVAPLWCVGTTADEDRANMVWGSYAVQVLQGLEFSGPLPLSSPPPKKVRRKTTPDDKDPVIENCVRFPVLTNAVDLKPGDELLVYHAAVEKVRERQVQAIKVSALAAKKTA